MTDMKALFDVIRDIKGEALTQRDVDRVNAVAEVAAQPEPKNGPICQPLAMVAQDVPHFATIAAHLEREEGRIRHAYQDHLGYWTIGVGRLIDKRKGGHLSDAEIDMLLANDIRAKMAALESHPGLKDAWTAVKDNPARAAALLSMAFQMGAEGLADFKNSLRLVAEKKWAAAAANMMQSLWARQTPERAARVTNMIKTGRA